jgi:conjugal transfer pilus assembly protein TraA
MIRTSILPIFVVFISHAIAGNAQAGTDATMGVLYSWFSFVMLGSLGKVIAVCFLLTGLGIGIMKGSVKTIVLDIGAAVGCIYAPTVFDMILTATI